MNKTLKYKQILTSQWSEIRRVGKIVVNVESCANFDPEHTSVQFLWYKWTQILKFTEIETEKKYEQNQILKHKQMIVLQIVTEHCKIWSRAHQSRISLFTAPISITFFFKFPKSENAWKCCYGLKQGGAVLETTVAQLYRSKVGETDSDNLACLEMMTFENWEILRIATRRDWV